MVMSLYYLITYSQPNDKNGGEAFTPIGVFPSASFSMNRINMIFGIVTYVAGVITLEVFFWIATWRIARKILKVNKE